MDDQHTLNLFEEEQRYIKGTLIHSVYHNAESLYTVARIKVTNTNEPLNPTDVVIVGTMPPLYPDEQYIFWGSFTDHPKYGKQYVVQQFRKDLPQTKQGMVHYLSGDLFSGIGKKTAESVIDVLGEDAFSKILENKNVLKDVPKLPEEKSQVIYETLLEHQGLEKVMVTLNKYGIGPALAMKIFQLYKENALTIIQTNPYQLIYNIEGIGFHRADELGQAMGIDYYHPERFRAGILYCLQEYSFQEGHVFLTHDQLLKESKQLLFQKREAIPPDFEKQILVLEEDEKLVKEEDRIYWPSLYFAEKGFITSIQRIMKQTDYEAGIPLSEFYKTLGDLEERLNLQYAESQKEAIRTALFSPIMALTGGPGTGKTTVIKGIVEVYAEIHGLSLKLEDYSNKSPFPILLVAPTGRAAKRMNESTGLPAVTIHRLLGWQGDLGFEKDENNLVEGRLLIIDEMSMVDMWLANQLFKSLPEDIQVVIVGDEDQLPSVGPGQVLKDVLLSNVIPVVQLTDIYRQAEGSSIIRLAHSIKNGELPADLNEPQSDRRFLNCNQTQVLEVIKQVCQNAIRKGYSPRDIQVLAPMYRGSAGIDQLNLTLQQLFNPKNDQKREINFNGLTYRVGDKVLQLVNDPEQHVFNGDMGEIVSIFYAKETEEKEDQVVISFDGREVTYHKKDLNQITLSYCCSIHKSQGSEFSIVVLPIVKGYYRMLRRNLIYTAVTRSKNFLILCGEYDALGIAVKRADEAKRNSLLEDKLRDALMENVAKNEPNQ
jgi:exodeoxyribonuclease V alpha subunit